MVIHPCVPLSDCAADLSDADRWVNHASAPTARRSSLLRASPQLFETVCVRPVSRSADQNADDGYGW